MTRARLACLLFALCPLAAASCGPPRSPSAGDEFDRALAEYEEAQRLRLDQPDWARELFRSAARRWEGLAASGLVNGYLEYNMGNCHLQAGDLGRAVLHYRRAQRLIPRDALLTDNLAVARTRCLLNIPSTRGARVLRSVFFWHYDTSMPGRARTALVAYGLFWLLLALRGAVPRLSVLGFAGLAGLVAAAAGGSYFAQRWMDRNAPAAVVVASDVAVYKGPATTYQQQFAQPLQPGVEVTIRERRGEWCHIELPDNKRGWVQSRAVEAIPEDDADRPAYLPI